jgi:hypothetical protein
MVAAPLQLLWLQLAGPLRQSQDRLSFVLALLKLFPNRYQAAHGHQAPLQLQA